MLSTGYHRAILGVKVMATFHDEPSGIAERGSVAYSVETSGRLRNVVDPVSWVTDGKYDGNTLQLFEDVGQAYEHFHSHHALKTPWLVGFDKPNRDGRELWEEAWTERLPEALLADTLSNKLAAEDLMVLPPGGQMWKRGEENA